MKMKKFNLKKLVAEQAERERLCGMGHISEGWTISMDGETWSDIRSPKSLLDWARTERGKIIEILREYTGEKTILKIGA